MYNSKDNNGKLKYWNMPTISNCGLRVIYIKMYYYE